MVEDEPLVGLEIVEALAACGAHVISARRELSGEDCLVLCQYLSERQIPFAFYTGYTTSPDGWSNVPIINKPAHEIVDTVERLCGSHQQAA